MKNFLCIILVIFISSLSACSTPTDNKPSESKVTQNNTDISSQDENNSTDTYNKQMYIDVNPADITEAQVKELMANIIPRYVEVFGLFRLGFDENELDRTQVCPFDKYYIFFKDERFSCVKDIRDYTLEVMTEEAAKKAYFDIFLDGPYNPDTRDVNRYIDYEGKLYCSTHTSGTGFFTEFFTETSKIVERTENSVKIEINTRSTDNTWVFTPTLVKTKDGWRVDSDMYEGYYRENQSSNDKQTTGVIYLDSYTDYNQYIEQIKTSKYLSEYAFLSELSKDEFISVSEGTQTFAILPPDSTASVCVYKLIYDEELNKAQNGDLLYSSNQAIPIVVKCNFSDIYPDVNIKITAKDGTVTEFSPQSSMKDGKLEILSEAKHLITDLTKY